MPLKLNVFTGNFDIVNATVSTELKSADFNAEDKKIYIIDSSGGPISVTLPTVGDNKTITFKDIGNAETNNITINVLTLLSHRIDTPSAVSYIMNSNYESLTLVCQGNTWYIT